MNSFTDFERLYGGLWAQSTLGYAVQQFFLNGGSQALIVRVEGDGNGGITDADIIASLPMLDQAGLFNLLCIPPLKRHGGDVGKNKNWRHGMLARSWPDVIARTYRFVCVSHAVAETELRRGTPENKLIVLPIGVWRAHRHRITDHKRIMTMIFGGALVIAGLFTFVPGRIMHAVVFGH